MRIAIFTDTFYPTIDGVVTATLNLIKGLADRGHKVYVIAPKVRNLEKEFRYPNVIIKRMISSKAFYYEGYRASGIFSPILLLYLKSKKIELIHIQTPFSLGLQGIIKAKILKVPLVGTFHTMVADLQYLKHFKMNYSLFEKAIWRCIRSLYYNRCDLITCPSETTKNELLQHRFKRPIKVISNGIDYSIFDNSRWKKVKEEYNKDGKLLLFVGRIAHGKNIPYLLECFKLVLKKLPKTKLLIVGDGPQRKEIKDKIKELRISKNVIMAGSIEHKQLVKSSVFGACDLFVTASTTETQGIALLEGQVNGLVCVGVDKRGISNLIRDGYNGYLIKEGNKQEFADKVVKLLQDKKLYNRMKLNTLKEIKKHELNNVIGQWEKEYFNLIKNSKKQYVTLS